MISKEDNLIDLEQLEVQEKCNSNNYWKYRHEPSANQKDDDFEIINEASNAYLNNELEKVYELEMVYEFETFDQLEPFDTLEGIIEESANNEVVLTDESIMTNKFVATNETKANILYITKNVREKSAFVEEEKNCQFLTSDEIRSSENLKERKSYINIESLECLAINYIKENDTENIYKVLNTHSNGQHETCS